MSNHIKQQLEKELAEFAQRKHCILVSRAATALYVSYTVLKKSARLQSPVTQKKHIVLPSIICHSPANVSLYAGLDPVFCDVNTNDYTLDPDALENLLHHTPGVLAVLSVSIFGHAPDMKRITEICKKYNVSLIDDAAQSIGGSCNDKPFGGWGEIGIYSFGHSKIIDVGWGGAILTDDDVIYKACQQEYNTLNLLSEHALHLRTLYSETYYTIERLENKSLALAPLFWNFPDMFQDMYVFRDTDAPETKIKLISEKLKHLKAHNEERMKNWMQYRELLSDNKAFTLPVLRPGSAPWRFTCRIKKEFRANLVHQLREQKIDVSTWYPSLQKRFRPTDNLKIIPCKVASQLNDELLNLWIDPEHTNSTQIANTCALINKLGTKE